VSVARPWTLEWFRSGILTAQRKGEYSENALSVSGWKYPFFVFRERLWHSRGALVFVFFGYHIGSFGIPERQALPTIIRSPRKARLLFEKGSGYYSKKALASLGIIRVRIRERLWLLPAGSEKGLGIGLLFLLDRSLYDSSPGKTHF